MQQLEGGGIVGAGLFSDRVRAQPRGGVGQSLLSASAPTAPTPRRDRVTVDGRLRVDRRGVTRLLPSRAAWTGSGALRPVAGSGCCGGGGSRQRGVRLRDRVAMAWVVTAGACPPARGAASCALAARHAERRIGVAPALRDGQRAFAIPAHGWWLLPWSNGGRIGSGRTIAIVATRSPTVGAYRPLLRRWSVYFRSLHRDLAHDDAATIRRAVIHDLRRAADAWHRGV
jgi:hypothetical protein